MEESRTRNSIRNIFAGWINKVVTLLFPFVIQTIMIRVLGAEYLGLSTLFTSILQAFAVVELGFSSAIVFSMYKPIAVNDKETICALMALYRRVYYILGSIVIALGLALMPFLRYFVKSDLPGDVNIYFLFILYLINTSSSFFLFSYKSCLLTAHQRNDVVSNIHSAIITVQYVLQIILLLVFKDYYVYFIITPICTIVNNLTTAYVAGKYYPDYICKGNLNDEQTNDIRIRLKGLIINKVSRVSKNTFDSIFISSFNGLILAAKYSNYFLIMNALQNLMAAVIPAMTASVGNSIVLENEKKNYKDFRIINFMYTWLGGWISICLLCMYQPFIELWMGKDMQLPFYTMLLFCVCLFINANEDMLSLYIQATGLWGKTKKIYLWNAVTNLVLNFVLVRILGVFGVVLATVMTTISFGVIGVGRVLFQEYFISEKFRDYLLEQGKYIFILFLGGYITYWIVENLNISGGIIGMIIRLGVCIVLPNIIFLLCWRNNDNLKNIVRRLKKM